MALARRCGLRWIAKCGVVAGSMLRNAGGTNNAPEQKQHLNKLTVHKSGQGRSRRLKSADVHQLLLSETTYQVPIVSSSPTLSFPSSDLSNHARLQLCTGASISPLPTPSTSSYSIVRQPTPPLPSCTGRSRPLAPSNNQQTAASAPAPTAIKTRLQMACMPPTSLICHLPHPQPSSIPPAGKTT